MSIDRERVLHTARLAELEIAESELPTLVQQLSSIVDYVDQLAALPGAGTDEPHRNGPGSVTLREDAVAPIPLARSVAELAPEFADGFFLVPRRGALADE